MRCSPLFVALVLFTAACASSSSGGPVDADDRPVDAPAADAEVPDAVPDAEPCVPNPDGETCNGVDDDCDDAVDEGYEGVGEPCEVGIGACVNAGTTVCTQDGASTECGVQPLPPGEELCGNGVDDDCDTEVDEGFPQLGTPCSVGTGACLATGVYVCSESGLSTVCDASPGDPQAETCNGADDDCDTFIDEDFQINQSCDGGGDTDLCHEGVWVCDGAGGRECTDQSGSTVDLCGGGDDDCDPASADGAEDSRVGQGCDGASDSDLCVEGVNLCVGGSLTCTDNTGSTVDLCGGGDDDCDPASADGSEDPAVGVACDGAADSDLCAEALTTCGGGAIQCLDATGSTVDLCGGGDEDCDPASADGSEHPGLGASCDGGDSDLCAEGAMQCAGTTLACSDTTGSTVDLCGNGDEDCDPASADGAEDPLVGVSCDGPNDTDSCLEATSVCSGGAIACPDNTSSTVELCNGAGADEDCQGGVDEDWNRDDNPSCTGSLFNLGSMSGDTGSGYATDSWYDEEWDSILLTEDNNGDVYLSATIRLYSPPGVDFDLYLRCASCGGGVVQSSTVAGLTGHYDYLYPRWGDDWLVGDDETVVVEVRHKQSNLCAYWTLEVWGNTDLSGHSDTCDP